MAPNNALLKSSLGDDEKKDNTKEEQAPRGVISSEEVRSRGTGVNPGRPGPKGTFMSEEWRKFLVAVMFLTRLPCPSWVDHSPADLVPGMAYFVVIGSMVGFWVGVWYEALITMFSSTVAAAGSTLMGVWLTGCFHEDGLADTLDSFGGGWGRVQILRIMKDSRVGTYAVVGVSLCMIVRVSLIASQGSTWDTRIALIVAHTLARLTSVWMVKLFPYVHDEGDDKGLLYNTFAGCVEAGLLTWPRVFFSTAFCIVMSVSLVDPIRLPFLAILMPAFVVSAGRYATKVIGGVIGDFLGASIMLCEVMVYMTLTAKIPDSFFDSSFLGPWVQLGGMLGLLLLFLRGAGDLPYVSGKDC